MDRTSSRVSEGNTSISLGVPLTCANNFLDLNVNNNWQVDVADVRRRCINCQCLCLNGS